MASSNRNGVRTPFQYLSNTQPSDPKELKRQRDRERYAQNRDEILKRRREAHTQKKAAAALVNGDDIASDTPVAVSHAQELKRQSGVTQMQNRTPAEGMPHVGLHSCSARSHEAMSSQLHGGIFSNKENINYDDDSDWLHRNDAYMRQEILGRRRPSNVPCAHNPQTMSPNLPVWSSSLLTPLSEVLTAQQSRILITGSPDFSIQTAVKRLCQGITIPFGKEC